MGRKLPRSGGRRSEFAPENDGGGVGGGGEGELELGRLGGELGYWASNWRPPLHFFNPDKRLILLVPRPVLSN